MMNLVMTSAPIAMVGCGHSVTRRDARHPVACARHVCAELLHRHLIVRFGMSRIIALGLIAHRSLSAAIGIAGISRSAISGSAWCCSGVGWNFAFIGATTMVTQCHRPEERNKVQSFNDFLIFGTMAIGSFSSGQLLATLGWAFVNAAGIPAVLAVGALLAWVALRQRPQSWPKVAGVQVAVSVGIAPPFLAISARCVGGCFSAYPRHIQPGWGAVPGMPRLKYRGIP